MKKLRFFIGILAIAMTTSGCLTSMIGGAAGSVAGSVAGDAIKGQVRKSPGAFVTAAEAPVAVRPQEVPQWMLLNQSQQWSEIISLRSRLDVKDLMSEMMRDEKAAEGSQGDAQDTNTDY